MNKGCAFEIKDGVKCRYFTAQNVSGLVDFVAFLIENRADAAGVPLPLYARIPQTVEISETAWRAIGDDLAACTRFSAFFVVDVCSDLLWGNEDIGDGMAFYLFSFSAVMEAATGTPGLWEHLLAQFPDARKG